MPEAPYTPYRTHQFKGPLDSADYNDQVETRYKDLVVLYNWLNQLQEQAFGGAKISIKDILGLANKISKLEDVMTGPGWSNAPHQHVSFRAGSDNIDADRFDGTSFEVNDVDQLAVTRDYPGLVLPPAGSTAALTSNLVLGGATGFVPDSVETNVVGSPGSADSVGSIIDTTQPELSFGRIRGANWERNVIVDTVDPDGAQLTLYIKVPPDVSPNAKSNYVAINPYPAFSVDILSVSTSTNADVTLSEMDNYLPINRQGLYSGQKESVGFSAPGGWSGDQDLMAGQRLWLFEPEEVTAVKIVLRQRNYYVENSNYVYTYGANFIDVGYMKALDTGKTMIKVDAPAGTTFDDDLDVVPQIFNIPQSYLPDAFSYRTIWETAYGSGIYTTTPVPLSKRVWVEVTLNRPPNGTVPVLSGIYINRDTPLTEYDHVYVQPTEPDSPEVGDIWVDTSGGTRTIHDWDGTVWEQYFKA